MNAFAKFSFVVIFGGVIVCTALAHSAEEPFRMKKKPVMRFPPAAMNVAPNSRAVSATVLNGKRTVNVDEPNRKIRIEDTNGQNIKVRITETIDGKEKKTEHEAVDLKQLQANAPEAARLYEEFAAAGSFPDVAPLQLVPVHAASANATRANKEVESALDQIESCRKKLKQLPAGPIDPKAMEEIIDELDLAKKTLFAAQAALK